MTRTESDAASSDTTSVAPPDDITSNTGIVREGAGESETTASATTPGATVPASIEATPVWLRYNPHRIRIGRSDSATRP
jgi:hypothetical protein